MKMGVAIEEVFAFTLLHTKMSFILQIAAKQWQVSCELLVKIFVGWQSIFPRHTGICKLFFMFEIKVYFLF